jgi:hypothetical protein
MNVSQHTIEIAAHPHVLFTEAKLWNHSKCLSIGMHKENRVYIYNRVLICHNE